MNVVTESASRSVLAAALSDFFTRTGLGARPVSRYIAMINCVQLQGGGEHAGCCAPRNVSLNNESGTPLCGLEVRVRKQQEDDVASLKRASYASILGASERIAVTV